MSQTYRRTIPLVLTGIFGAIIFLDFATSSVPMITSAASTLKSWAVLVSTTALGIGLINLLYIHYRSIVRRTPGMWYFSVWVYILVAITLVAGLGLGVSSTLYASIYDSMFMQPYNTAVTFLCLSTFAAGYRAIRAKDLGSTLLVIGTVFVMMWYAPIGEIIWPGFATIGQWLYFIPGTGTQRAIMIGVGIGALGVGIKTLLGIERGWLGRRGGEEK